MVKWASILMMAIVVADPVRADVVKCIAPDGSVHYSDHGCMGEVSRSPVAIRPAPLSAANGAKADRYSVMQQYRHLHDAQNDMPIRRRPSKRRLHQVDRVRLNEIEQALRALESKERVLRGEHHAGSNIRRQWTREELAAVRAEIRSLKRQRENILRAR